MSLEIAPRQPLAILGTSLFAPEVADLAADTGLYDVRVFIENHDPEKAGTRVVDRPIVWIDEAAPLADTHWAICALGTTHRRGFIAQAEALGFEFATLVHPASRISSRSTIGAGTIVSVGVIVAAQTEIGCHVILNRGVLIGHDTRVHDFVTISPGANIAGAVTIGDGAYIGMGAIVVDRVRIGRQAVVAAGAVVTRDVPDRAQVAGMPARIVRRDVDGR